MFIADSVAPSTIHLLHNEHGTRFHKAKGTTFPGALAVLRHEAAHQARNFKVSRQIS